MNTSPDIRVLFSTRIIRLFCYGLVSVILALYLVEAGLDERQVGLLFSFTLAGDAGITLWMTTSADAFGRRRILRVGALLMLISGAVFMASDNFGILLLAAVFGVISPHGKEIGPFLSIEQAALSQLVRDEERTQVFAWYNLAGSMAAAFGALGGGWLAQLLEASGFLAIEAYRAVLLGYALGGVALLLLFMGLSPRVEAAARAEPAPARRVLGLHRSRNTVAKLSALFALDAFGGGLIVQSMLAYWFYIKFGVDAGAIGSIFFGVNLLAALSALAAAWLARRIGLINTMIFTHLPSNVLLMLVPFMPTLPLAIGVLLMRFSISQMDVPTRQSYTMAVVAPDERSAASGVTTIARSVGAAISPALTGLFLSVPSLLSLPFLLAGAVKLVYDGLLYVNFRRAKPPEELARAAPPS
ncbi:MAG: MFS transporter [Chloroflexota bacterium]